MGVWVEEENIDDSQNHLSVHNWIRSIECHCLGRRFKIHKTSYSLRLSLAGDLYRLGHIIKKGDIVEDSR
jgi:hypothetical protein